MVTVTRIDDSTWKVEVPGRVTTTHTVTASDAICRQLAGRDIDPECVIVESFRFLLEREPNTAILSRFELPVIGRYFPEYPDEIRRRTGGTG
jgi:hypothetical protein